MVPGRRTEAQTDEATEAPAEVPAPLYKATVNVRWRNRLTRARNNVRAGTVVEFEDGDFEDPATGAVTGALVSLEDALGRGLFVPWDASTAGDIDSMTRDELAVFLEVAGVDGPDGEPWPHNADPEVLRDAARAALEAKREA